MHFATAAPALLTPMLLTSAMGKNGVDEQKKTKQKKKTTKRGRKEEERRLGDDGPDREERTENDIMGGRPTGP